MTNQNFELPTNEKDLMTQYRYLTDNYDVTDYKKLSDVQLLELVERTERIKSIFSKLREIKSPYSRNEDVLGSYRYFKNENIKLETMAESKGLIELDYESYSW